MTWANFALGILLYLGLFGFKMSLEYPFVNATGVALIYMDTFHM
jgi:hypothetical protein